GARSNATSASSSSPGGPSPASAPSEPRRPIERNAMPLALTSEHQALAEVARALLADRAVLAEARAQLDAPGDALPPSWAAAAELGWLGLHVPEAHGGQGYGLAELAVVLVELGRVVAPGPSLPTVWAAAVLVAAGSPVQQSRLLSGLADGSRRGAV